MSTIKLLKLIIISGLIKYSQNFVLSQSYDDVFLQSMTKSERNFYCDDDCTGMVNYEILGVPKGVMRKSKSEIKWHLKVFGNELNLVLKKNFNLMKRDVHDEILNDEEMESIMNYQDDCHYLMIGDEMTAALSNCEKDGIV